MDTTENDPGKKRGRGRPPVDEAERLSYVVQLRLNRRLYNLTWQLADWWDCPQTEAIRRVLEDKIDEIERGRIEMEIAEGTHDPEAAQDNFRWMLGNATPVPESFEALVKRVGVDFEDETSGGEEQ